MIILTWISAFLLIQSSQSYVLLTANLDDVQNLLQQVLQSPAAEKVGQYVRRAASMFNQHMRSHNGDDKDLKESPLARQVVNVLRNAYTVIKDQFKEVDKDNDSQTARQTKKQEVNTVESSVEMDNTRRRSRHQVHHSRHKHSRKHYPVAHGSRSRRAEAVDSKTDTKTNVPAESKGAGAPASSYERREKLKVTNEMLSLGKNATRYLNTIKEIIEATV